MAVVSSSLNLLQVPVSSTNPRYLETVIDDDGVAKESHRRRGSLVEGAASATEPNPRHATMEFDTDLSNWDKSLKALGDLEQLKREFIKEFLEDVSNRIHIVAHLGYFNSRVANASAIDAETKRKVCLLSDEHKTVFNWISDELQTEVLQSFKKDKVWGNEIRILSKQLLFSKLEKLSERILKISPKGLSSFYLRS